MRSPEDWATLVPELACADIERGAAQLMLESEAETWQTAP